MSRRSERQTVPLSVLLKRELANEKIEKPEIVHGQAIQSKKGEDFTLIKTECQRVMGDGVSTYSVFGVCYVSFSHRARSHSFFLFGFDGLYKSSKAFNVLHRKSIPVMCYFTRDTGMTR